MSSLVTFALVSFGTVFSIVDPFTAVPVFLALVGDAARPVQARTAMRAAATCFVVLTTFGLAGSYIFDFFGITIPAFARSRRRRALRGRLRDDARQAERHTTNEEAIDAGDQGDVRLIPLGLPLIGWGHR